MSNITNVTTSITQEGNTEIGPSDVARALHVLEYRKTYNARKEVREKRKEYNAKRAERMKVVMQYIKQHPEVVDVR